MPSFNAYAQQNPGNLDVLRTQKFHYGTTPKQAVAEQNQTYFAYFDGVGGTGPEYIDGTAYFIKYLIDTEGNVVNPEPFTTADSPQAVGLYNLTDNFEVGKNAVVKLIESDPTLDEIPNAEILQGTHRIAHVGRIVPILVTETGENKQDYITTMSFGSLSTQTSNTPTTTITNTVANVTTQFQYTGDEYEIGGTLEYNAIDFDYELLLSPAWENVTPSLSSKRILSSSVETNTRIRLRIDLYLEETWGSGGADPFNTVWIRVYQNSNIIIDNRSMLGPIGSEAPNQTILDGEGGVYSTGWSSYFDYNENDVFQVHAAVSDDRNSRKIKVKGVAGGRNQSILYIQQETPAGVTTESTEVALIPNVNIVTSDYFDGGTNSPNTINGGYSILTCSPELTAMWQSGQTQNLDSASALMGFSDIKIPFSDVKAGDFIRFEYRKDQIYTIFRTRLLDYGSLSTLSLFVTPALSTLDQPITIGDFYLDLNHFVIYRVLNDGVYITLDVKKDAPGGAFSGILQPEFISKELVQKYDKIIQTLTEKEIIN